MLSRGAFGGGLQSKQLFLKALGAESLSATPTARVSDDFVVLVIDGDRRGIGLHRELMAHVAWRHTVAVAIETQAEILVHERIDAIAIIQMDCGYELQTFWSKAFLGCLTGFTMTALIGHLLEPLMSCELMSDRSTKRRNGQKFCRTYPIARSTFPFSQAALT